VSGDCKEAHEHRGDCVYLCPHRGSQVRKPRPQARHRKTYAESVKSRHRDHAQSSFVVRRALIAQSTRWACSMERNARALVTSHV
jgi:hypothetical protein